MLIGHFRPKKKDAKIFENHINPAVLVFIGYFQMSTQLCKGFGHFSAFLSSQKKVLHLKLKTKIDLILLFLEV